MTAISQILQITPELVQEFSTWSGDYSSLHTNAVFARRSRYGKQVCHGMLPVMSLALHKGLVGKGDLRNIEINFINPIWINDSLIVEVISNEDSSFFSIKRTSSRTELIRGKCVFSNELAKPLNGTERSKNSSIISSVIGENSLSLSDIKKGEEHSFDFISDPELYKKFLSKLCSQCDNAIEEDCNYVTTLLSTAVFSTLIGMVLPGKTATFTSLTVECEKAIEQGVSYQVSSKVDFISQSAAMLVQKASVSFDKKCYLKAVLRAAVSKPEITMPSINEIKEHMRGIDLKGKVVLVTGGSRGIGEVVVKLLVEQGAHVCINYLSNKEKASLLIKEIEVSHPGATIAIQTDVSNFDAVSSMVKTIIEQFGRIDIVINNAASHFMPTPFLDLEWTTIQSHLDVIVKGAFNVTKAVLPLFQEQGGGRFISIVSSAVEELPAGQASYVTAKKAMMGLMQSVASEFGRKNNQSHFVIPGMVETDMTK